MRQQRRLALSGHEQCESELCPARCESQSQSGDALIHLSVTRPPQVADVTSCSSDYLLEGAVLDEALGRRIHSQRRRPSLIRVSVSCQACAAYAPEPLKAFASFTDK